MMRVGLLLVGGLGGCFLWPHLQADDRLMWAAVLPVVYIAGMWLLYDSNP